MYRRWPLIISLGFFIVACAAPALLLHVGTQVNLKKFVWTGYRTIPGYQLLYLGLVFGWIRLNFTAWANLPLWLSWIFFWRKRFLAARTCSIVALVFSVETLQLLVQPMLFDEGASAKGFLAAPHLGFFCWIGSMLVIFAASKMQATAADERLGSHVIA